jgi:hypothetical protein
MGLKGPAAANCLRRGCVRYTPAPGTLVANRVSLRFLARDWTSSAVVALAVSTTGTGDGAGAGEVLVGWGFG